MDLKKALICLLVFVSIFLVSCSGEITGRVPYASPTPSPSPSPSPTASPSPSPSASPSPTPWPSPSPTPWASPTPSPSPSPSPSASPSPSPSQEVLPWCDDTDGGIKEFDYGRCIDYTDSELKDVCLADGITLYERYCDSNKKCQTREILCEHGCIEQEEPSYCIQSETILEKITFTGIWITGDGEQGTIIGDQEIR